METRPTVIRQEKVALVDELTDQLNRSNMAVLTDYRGLNVAQMADLQHQLRAAEVELRVVKNTLARLAAQKSGSEALLPELVGPTAIAFGFGDPAALSKALTDAIRAQRLPMRVKSALLGDRLLAGSDVERIAQLPPRDVLLGQVAGALMSPMAGLVNTLNGVVQNLVLVLDARRAQLEGGAE